jgi:hypothetical protein
MAKAGEIPRVPQGQLKSFFEHLGILERFCIEEAGDGQYLEQAYFEHSLSGDRTITISLAQDRTPSVKGVSSILSRELEIRTPEDASMGTNFGFVGAVRRQSFDVQTSEGKRSRRGSYQAYFSDNIKGITEDGRERSIPSHRSLELSKAIEMLRARYYGEPFDNDAYDEQMRIATEGIDEDLELQRAASPTEPELYAGFVVVLNEVCTDLGVPQLTAA